MLFRSSGRFFNDQTPASAADLIAGTPGLELVETFLTGDQLGRAQGWTNVLARRAEQL